ncbi:MAG TPA: hypothetical protein PKA58_22165 [Polyangium sp.]|nr:hypothetical protein [Polyangium sp.]
MNHSRGLINVDQYHSRLPPREAVAWGEVPMEEPAHALRLSKGQRECIVPSAVMEQIPQCSGANRVSSRLRPSVQGNHADIACIVD